MGVFPLFSTFSFIFFHSVSVYTEQFTGTCSQGRPQGLVWGRGEFFFAFISPFHKTLPKSNLQLHWSSERFMKLVI